MNGKLVLGVGVYERGKYFCHDGATGKKTKEYIIWRAMLRRCFSSTYHKEQPSYIGCSVSENFKNFQFFAEWCNNQIGFGNKRWQLDKDLLIRGNKQYTEDSCVFIPEQLNYIIIQNRGTRGKYPIGVSFDKERNNYQAQLNKSGKATNLGRYSTAEEAFLAYKVAKEAHVKYMAELYKNQMEPRAYEALLGWKVNLSD